MKEVTMFYQGRFRKGCCFSTKNNGDVTLHLPAIISNKPLQIRISRH
jgi:hypothetical protein